MTPNAKTKIKLEKSAERATRWIGSTNSLVVHTIFFIISFILPFFGITFEKILLVLTTIVSLEAIYLAIFIQMSVNKNTKDIEIIQEDVEEIQEDVDEIQKDVDEIQEDVDEIQEDIEEIEEEETEVATLTAIQTTLAQLQKEIEQLRK
jgi:low affinity Fe/Cu permease